MIVDLIFKSIIRFKCYDAFGWLCQAYLGLENSISFVYVLVSTVKCRNNLKIVLCYVTGFISIVDLLRGGDDIRRDTDAINGWVV
ncbi:hypothetical protein SLEP1_g27878 [Rubroshorea leprosula]|uniref:Uncharacterized protein n=1 Tax=Rubroshorea leprosula TaxID=152421 RepID=A0AAV5JRT0_9ROSI|nr:hypothetical protein SLEP1_g27878 [Rubroshorea leprosula]